MIPPAPETAVTQALDAEARADWPLALQRWGCARRQYPEMALAWAHEISLLRHTGQNTAASALADLALSRFPDNLAIAIQHQHVAMDAQDWALAEQRWHEIQGRFADDPALPPLAQAIARHLAHGRQGEDLRAKIGQAHAAADARDWPLAAELWRGLHTLTSNDAGTALHYGHALRQLGQLDAAEAVLSQGLADHPGHRDLRAQHAELAAQRGNWQEAANRWAVLLATHEDTHELELIAATAFREAGRLDEAEKLIRRILAGASDQAEPHTHLARIKERQGDWSAAVAAWDIVHRLQPADPDILHARGAAIWEEAAKRLERGEKPAQSLDASDTRQLALGFESLGDHCEFGIVQRHLGAEPLGLFRFAGIDSGTLARLACSGFAELGNPDHLELRVTDAQEYLLADRRGLYQMHSFVRCETVDADEFLAQQILRIGYLKRKLITDLRAADKIFVHKSSHRRISDDDAMALHTALQAFGPVRLLVMRQAEPGRAPGAVEWIRERLFCGYIGTVYGAGLGDIDFGSWRRVLEAVSV